MGRVDRVVFIRLEQVDIVTLLKVLQLERFAGQEFVKEPYSPGVLASWFGSNVFENMSLLLLPETDWLVLLNSYRHTSAQIRDVLPECLLANTWEDRLLRLHLRWSRFGEFRLLLLVTYANLG